MKTKIIRNKLVSLVKSSAIVLLVALPFNAQAEYYVTYGPSGCATCATYHRVVHRYHGCHKVYKHRVHKVYRYTNGCNSAPQRRPGHYRMTVYYPVPVYATPCGGCCGCGTAYYSEPAYSGVYFVEPRDRLVGNSYTVENYYGSPQDTGTADNDYY